MGGGKGAEASQASDRRRGLHPLAISDNLNVNKIVCLQGEEEEEEGYDNRNKKEEWVEKESGGNGMGCQTHLLIIYFSFPLSFSCWNCLKDYCTCSMTAKHTSI